jgi:hypothetical protein
MMNAGARKAALYLASLTSSEQSRLLAALPSGFAAELKPLIAQIVANGWNDPVLIQQALAEEIRGLTQQSSLSVDVILALANSLPDDWTARLFVANSAIDTKFLTSLLETPHAKRVKAEMISVQRLPEQLKAALLAEAIDSIVHSA